MQPCYTLDELINRVPEPVRHACKRLYEENRDRIARAPGSTHNHQCWPGGYLDHVIDTMHIAGALYPTLSAIRPLPFTLADALLVMLLHDIEKPWRIVHDPDGGYGNGFLKADSEEFRNELLKRYNIWGDLTDDHKNALKYVEGEHVDYKQGERKMGPLAAFCHLCDVTSARIWFDYPKNTP
jgi:hypothetical protein